MTRTDDPLVKQLVAELEAEESALPASLSRQLVDARRAARLRTLEAGQSRRGRSIWQAAGPVRWPQWRYVTSIAAVGFLAVMIGRQLPPGPDTLLPGPDTTAAVTSTTADSINLLSSPDDIDFYQSVDFLLWLEQQG